MEGGIIWLASYPKSGNTWMRALLSNYNSNSDKPVSINELDTDGIASSRGRFDEFVGVDSSEMTFDEIDNLRPDVYEHIAQETRKRLYIKAHDAYTYLPDGRGLIPNDNSKFIYIVRNPLDIVPSLSNHSGKSIESTVDFICDQRSCFSKGKRGFNLQLRQKLLTWASHVKSYIYNEELELIVIRYEDMQQDINSTFKRVLEFCELEIDEERLKKAIEFSDFKILQKQEQQEGFKERSPSSDKFFFSGKVGTGKDKLTPEQIEKIIAVNGSVMRELGYI